MISYHKATLDAMSMCMENEITDPFLGGMYVYIDTVFNLRLQ